jgi:hypothetical protein
MGMFLFFPPCSVFFFFHSYCLFKSRQWMLGALPRSHTYHSLSLCWVCVYIELPSVTVHPFMAWCLAQGLFYLYQEENSFQFFILSIACVEHCPYWIRETFMVVSNCKERERELQGVLLDNTVCRKDYIALVMDEWNVSMEHWHMATDRGK